MTKRKLIVLLTMFVIGSICFLITFKMDITAKGVLPICILGGIMAIGSIITIFNIIFDDLKEKIIDWLNKK